MEDLMSRVSLTPVGEVDEEGLRSLRITFKPYIKRVHRYIKIIQKEFKLKLPPTMPQELICVYCSKLSLSWQVGTGAIKFLESLKNKMNFSGRSPKSLACAALYYSCNTNNERRSQKEITEVSGITETSVRQNYRTLKDILP